VRARKAPDAGTDDDDVIVLADGLPAQVVAAAVAHPVRDGEIRGLAAALAGSRCGSDPARHDCAGHAVEKVTARNALTHRFPPVRFYGECSALIGTARAVARQRESGRLPMRMSPCLTAIP